MVCKASKRLRRAVIHISRRRLGETMTHISSRCMSRRRLHMGRHILQPSRIKIIRHLLGYICIWQSARNTRPTSSNTRKIHTRISAHTGCTRLGESARLGRSITLSRNTNLGRSTRTTSMRCCLGMYKSTAFLLMIGRHRSHWQPHTYKLSQL